MRYYLYISDAKVDMLLPQVPGAVKKRVAAKIGFDMKILSGSVSSESTTLDERVARLQVVEDYIRSQEPVGPDEDFTSWIEGDAVGTLLDLAAGAILFLIASESRILGLGGSARHLIGNESAIATAANAPFSFLSSIASNLALLSDRKPKHLLRLEGAHLSRHTDPDSGFEQWISVMGWLANTKQGIPQPLSFLAKRLVSQQDNWGKTYTLASPLFVAMG